MLNNGLVTIIMPIYNVYPFLAEAIDSVIHQSYINLEILLVDDGSTDGSEKLCDDYAQIDKRIKVIHQENIGLSGARNIGLDMANGVAIAFLDSDDAYHSEFVMTMMNEMVRNEADMVVCHYSIQYTTRRMIERKTRNTIEQSILNRREAFRGLVNGEIDHHVWDKLYSRKILEHIRYPVGHVYEDIDTTYRIIDQCEKICVLSAPLYLHRKRTGSIANTFSSDCIHDSILANRHFIEFVTQNIPDIFTFEDLILCQQAWLRKMINYYLQLPWNIGSKNELRKLIISTGFCSGTDKLSLLYRTTYLFIRYFPLALRITYPVYHRIRIIMAVTVSKQTTKNRHS